MSSFDTDRLMSVAKDFVGCKLRIRGKDYGTVRSFFSISDGGSTRVLLETSLDKRVDLASVLTFLSRNRLQPFFPDGTTYAQYVARPKPIYRHQVMFPANIPSTVRHELHSFSISAKEK